MIKATVTYAGGRNNSDGEAWIKYDVPQSELAQIAPFFFMVDTVLHMVADIDSERHYVGYAMSNNIARTPKGNAIITLRGVTKNIKTPVLDLMPGKSFELRLLTEQELQELVSDVAGQETALETVTDDADIQL